MVIKLNDRIGKSQRTSDGKRVTFDKEGRATSSSVGLPMKTSAVDKE